MQGLRQLAKSLRYWWSNDGFKRSTYGFEALIAKVLALGMIVVILVAAWDLGCILVIDVLTSARPFLSKTLLELFGVFLTLLIALELLQNITAYLREHTVQLELVIVTSLTAVARKIILLDLEKISGVQLVGLAISVLTLSLSYWIIRATNRGHHDGGD